MASFAQQTVNQANAQLSTGPRTDAGKAISSRNHTAHGLTADPEKRTGSFQVLAIESQADFDRKLAVMRAQWQVANETEEDLVERLVIHSWLTRRAQRLMDKIIERSEDTGMSKEDMRQFQLYERYYNGHQRHYNKALADLMRLKNFALRQAKQQQQMEQKAIESVAKQQIRFESQSRATAKHELQMQILTLRLERAQKAQNHPKVSTTAAA